MTLIKLVKGTNDSVRVTIPKKLIEKLGWQNQEYVWFEAKTDLPRIIITPITVQKEVKGNE